MREILFRAKRIDNEEWIYGYIVKLGRERLSDPERYGLCNKTITIDDSGACYNLKVYEIIPETVEQYTGLTDKNGKKIFEGDILDCGDRIVFVKWHSYCGTWDSVFIKYSGDLCSNGITPAEWKYRAVVIGNIHDNTELLKGGAR